MSSDKKGMSSSDNPGVVVSSNGVVSVDAEKIKLSRAAFGRFRSAGRQRQSTSKNKSELAPVG